MEVIFLFCVWLVGGQRDGVSGELRRWQTADSLERGRALIIFFVRCLGCNDEWVEDVNQFRTGCSFCDSTRFAYFRSHESGSFAGSLIVWDEVKQ